MPFNYGLCQCAVRQSTRYFLKRLVEEIIEFVCAPSMDELSDVMCILSHIVHNITGVAVTLPFAQRSLDKGKRRAIAHGCVRSYRNRCNK